MSASMPLKIEISRTEILAAFHQGVDKVIELIESLITLFTAHLHAQAARIIQLEARVKELEDQVAKNSRNSSKPPSSDGYKKPPRSQRPRSERKAGGQEGHKGHTLKFSDTPDETAVHTPEQCECCGRSLSDIAAEAVEKRQVFDIPPIELHVTEHQAETKTCPDCSSVNKAAFPEGVNAAVQYGNRLKALATYLLYYQLIPYKRCQEFFGDLFKHPVGVASILKSGETCSEQLAPTQELIRELLLQSPVINNDESGYRIKGVRGWLHVASTPFLTFYYAHPKRGKAAMDAMNILPHYKGVSVHDYWKSYYKYDCGHALCNAHHLRDLIFVHEQQDQQWAQSMIKLLLAIKKKVDETKPHADTLPPEQIREFEQQYQQILNDGFEECHSKSPPPLQTSPPKRGRKKQSKAKNLLDRFKERPKEVLAFMYDFNVPFDNNLAERDLRMMKVQQKISGCFRTDKGAYMFCRIRSYISTARKQGINVIQAIKMAFDGKPYTPVSRPE